MLQLQHLPIYGKGLLETEERRKTKKSYKCNKVRYLVKNCRLEQKMKNRTIWRESDKKYNDKEKCFVRGLE